MGRGISQHEVGIGIPGDSGVVRTITLADDGSSNRNYDGPAKGWKKGMSGTGRYNHIIATKENNNISDYKTRRTNS